MSAASHARALRDAACLLHADAVARRDAAIAHGDEEDRIAALALIGALGMSHPVAIATARAREAINALP